MTDDLHRRDAVTPRSYLYRYTDPMSGKPVWRTDGGFWNGQRPYEAEALYSQVDYTAILARLARAEAALDAVDQVLESRIDQWESDDDLSDWAKPAKIIQADVADAILAQIEERGE